MNKFRGTTKECLFHYASHYWPKKGSRNLGQAQKPLTDFVEVKQGTIARWLSQSSKPIGLVLVRLRFFLETAGYEVSELRALKGTANYKLAEMLAYGLVTQEQASAELSFSEDYSILRIAHGGSSTSEARVQKIEALYKNFHANVLEKRTMLQEKVGLQSDSSAENGTSADSSVVPFSKASPASAQDEELITSIAHMVLSITPLLERVEKSSRDRRNLLRSLTGVDGMFRLSKVSSRLCSEKAREIVNGR